MCLLVDRYCTSINADCTLPRANSLNRFQYGVNTLWECREFWSLCAYTVAMKALIYTHYFQRLDRPKHDRSYAILTVEKRKYTTIFQSGISGTQRNIRGRLFLDSTQEAVCYEAC